MCLIFSAETKSFSTKNEKEPGRRGRGNAAAAADARQRSGPSRGPIRTIRRVEFGQSRFRLDFKIILEGILISGTELKHKIIRCEHFFVRNFKMKMVLFSARDVVPILPNSAGIARVPLRKSYRAETITEGGPKKEKKVRKSELREQIKKKTSSNHPLPNT